MLKRMVIAAGTSLLLCGAPQSSAAQDMREPSQAPAMTPANAPLRRGEPIPLLSMTLPDVQGAAAPDPVSNGVRNGAIVGAIGAGTVFGAVAWRSCEHRSCLVGLPLIWAGIGAGGGALVGLAIDRAVGRNRQVTSSPPPGLSAVVAPVLSPSQKGLSVALRW